MKIAQFGKDFISFSSSNSSLRLEGVVPPRAAPVEGCAPARPALHVWKLPLVDCAAAVLYPTFSSFARSLSMNVQRRSRGSATLPVTRAATPTRRSAHTPVRPHTASFVVAAMPRCALAGINQPQFKYAQVSRHPRDSATDQNQINPRTSCLDNH